MINIFHLLCSGRTTYIRKVICAPKPVLVMKDEQLDGVVKFCTNKVNFDVFQADPTFNLGHFSVTTTQLRAPFTT